MKKDKEIDKNLILKQKIIKKWKKKIIKKLKYVKKKLLKTLKIKTIEKIVYALIHEEDFFLKFAFEKFNKIIKIKLEKN